MEDRRDMEPVFSICTTPPCKLRGRQRGSVHYPHFWGYTKLKSDRTSEYQVEHPAWQVYDVMDYKIEVDAERLYGKPFVEILNRNPESVFLAEGSEVIVRKGKQV